MSSIDGISLFSHGLSVAAARRARRSQKAKAASFLQGEAEKEAQRPERIAQEETDPGLDHSGTEDAVPFRNAGPNPLFVAQLLGQLLPGPEPSSAAVAAYKEIALRLKLYDRLF